MRKLSFITVVAALLSVHLVAEAAVPDTVNVGPFGKVFVYNPSPSVKNVVIMISGDGGWKYGVVGFAETFSAMNNLVIGVDILRYYRDLRQRTDDCYRVATDFVELATMIQKKYDFAEYKPPVIMGYSSGATLVYGILAQARPGTFVGGISLGFCPDIELPKMLCETNGLEEKSGVPGKSYFLQPDAKLGNHWIVLHGELDKVCNYGEVVDFVKKTADAELISLPKTGHGFAKWSDFMPQWKEAFLRLTETTAGNRLPAVDGEKLKELPLVITNAKIQDNSAPLALIISGDGGWYSFEQSIADKMADIGIPTIGLDSKKYFWKRKTPEEASVDIMSALNYYSREWGRDKFILIGYSLGSEIVPFIVNRMPKDMKSKVVSSVLLSPETSTDFEIHISNMLGMGSRQNTYNVPDEILKMQPVHTLIIFGQGEKTKIPELLAGSDVIIQKIPGDHHYKFDLPLIMKTLKDNNIF